MPQFRQSLSAPTTPNLVEASPPIIATSRASGLIITMMLCSGIFLYDTLLCRPPNPSCCLGVTLRFFDVCCCSSAAILPRLTWPTFCGQILRDQRCDGDGVSPGGPAPDKGAPHDGSHTCAGIYFLCRRCTQEIELWGGLLTFLASIRPGLTRLRRSSLARLVFGGRLAR